MGHFLDYATAKRGMSEALNAVIASGADPYASSRALLTDAGTLLEAYARDGTLRTDVSHDDVLLAMSGIAQSTGQYGTREQAARLLDSHHLLTCELRAGTSRHLEGVLDVRH
jgi:hypothetical protein